MIGSLLTSTKNAIVQYLNINFRFFNGPVLAEVALEKNIIDEQNEVTIIPPITCDEQLHWKFKLRQKIFYPSTFVAVLSDARVWGNQGAVITKENVFCEIVSREYDVSGRNHSIFKQRHIVDAGELEGRVAVLAASGGDVYYHWMMDIIPRIDLLIRGGCFDSIDKFILNYRGLPFQRELLAMLGVPEERIIPSIDYWSFHMKAATLIVPSLVSPNDCPSERACLFLRKLFSSHINGRKPFRKIYIQRTKGRTISNEREIGSILHNEGFEIFHPELLTVAEQASMFSEATFVVGPHGAGFTNLVFCAPGTKVIDLFSPEWVNPCYWILSGHLNLKYAYLVGDDKKVRNGVDPMNRAADIRVDPLKLKELIGILEK